MKSTIKYNILMLFLLANIFSCSDEKSITEHRSQANSNVVIEAENYNFNNVATEEKIMPEGDRMVTCGSGGWLAYDIDIAVAGRYKVTIIAMNESDSVGSVWIEDYFDNQDDRTYNITGTISLPARTIALSDFSRDGSPLNVGTHKIKLHLDKGIKVDKIVFELLKKHEVTPVTLKQNTTGSDWVIAWADEFDNAEVDTNKWTYDIGDWGWGNFEEQYYTKGRQENARIEDGNLIIEARKDDMGKKWTSARLTTRGKVSFVHGKIEFRAKVPKEKGNWAAGWTLGDNYVDEISWPYCGEIDILESVGYEMDNETGNGVAHASAHCRAYYFKIGNQPTGIVEVEKMETEYHTYAVEWTADYIKAFVDDNLYFTYDDNSTEQSWPFDDPQNIILNLAMGGGWGGAQGMDESITSQKMIIDYVRVYERK